MCIKRMFLLISAIFMLAACACPNGSAQAPLLLNEADNGNAFELAVNQAASISLAANPTTGFSWKVAEIPSFMRQDGPEQYTPDSAEGGRVGSGGTSLWIFKAKAVGSGKLTLVYQRPWEDGKKPAKSVTYNITVNKN